MTKVRSKEDDDTNSLRLMDQATVEPGNLLDELLEPDRVVQAEYFLEACSSEGWISAVVINQLSFSFGT